MKSVIFSIVIGFCLTSVVFAQGQLLPIGMSPDAVQTLPLPLPQANGAMFLPTVPQQTVNVQSVNVPSQMPQLTSPPASPIVPPNSEAWRDGWKETWQHEFRPFKPYDYAPRPGNGYSDTSCYRPEDGWYYNPNTGNYQRNCQPTYVPQQQYVVPQQQYYVAPQQQYCVPQYQQRCYVPQCRQQYYYCQPQRTSWW
jgi:hypothetical protein